MNITDRAFLQLQEALPGMDPDYAGLVSKIMVNILRSNPNNPEDEFVIFVTNKLQSGSPWAIDLAVESIRKIFS